MSRYTTSCAFPFQYHYIDTRSSQLEGKRESTRTGTDDRHLAILRFHFREVLIGC